MELQIKLPVGFFKRDVGFRFDMLSWWLVCDLNGKELHEMGDIGQEQLLTDMLYAAYKSYCIAHNQRVKYPKSLTKRWADEMTNRDAKRFVDVMLSSKMFGKSVSEWGEQQKKRSPGTTLNGSLSGD